MPEKLSACARAQMTAEADWESRAVSRPGTHSHVASADHLEEAYHERCRRSSPQDMYRVVVVPKVVSAFLATFTQEEAQRSACGLVVESWFLTRALVLALQLRAVHVCGEAYPEQLSVVVFTMSTCEPEKVWVSVTCTACSSRTSGTTPSLMHMGTRFSSST